MRDLRLAKLGPSLESSLGEHIRRNFWRSVIGARLGRPWAHWNGALHLESWASSFWQAPTDSRSPNLMAAEREGKTFSFEIYFVHCSFLHSLLQALEQSTLCMVLGKTAAPLVCPRDLVTSLIVESARSGSGDGRLYLSSFSSRRRKHAGILVTWAQTEGDEEKVPSSMFSNSDILKPNRRRSFEWRDRSLASSVLSRTGIAGSRSSENTCLCPG